jgi:triacylglycerol esterase/lipase EstA (alpha/beta hydrolase family)
MAYRVQKLCFLVVLALSQVSLGYKFILVHGAWQNGEAFQGTADALRNLGYSTQTVNLPANFADATTEERASVEYDDYLDYMDDVLRRQSQDVILVCHSA